MSSWRYSVFDI